MNSHTEAFREGYQAYKDGVSSYDNPYTYDSDEWEEWDDGWSQAAWDD